MNLDKIIRNLSEPALPSVINFPQIVLHVVANDPLRTLKEDERGYYSKEGGIYPDDRHFLVTPEVIYASLHLLAHHKLIRTCADFNSNAILQR